MNNTRNSLVKAVITAAVLLAGSAALADWEIGDPYKMHYPQLPKTGGLDVAFASSILADDWLCIETGAVSDIHFWISWLDNQVQSIPYVNVQIYSDQPATGSSSTQFSTRNGSSHSRPDELLWSRQYVQGQFTVADMLGDPQGWFDPSGQTGEECDHVRWQQINITGITDPFQQQADTIYWLAIDFGDLPCVGWKESNDHFNDDAVWWDSSTCEWIELRNPCDGYSIDLAYVITPEPATLVLLAMGGLIARNRRRTT